MLSKKSKYGIKALTHIARSENPYTPTQIKTIAEAENISIKFLESIMLTLKKNGILSAKKGKGGGYYLRKKPDEISMVEVFRILEGPVALVPCVSLNYYEKCDDCKDEKTCAVNKLMVVLRDSTLKVLKNKTLADL